MSDDAKHSPDRTPHTLADLALTAEEARWAEKLLALFARVDARHPVRGIQTLRQRAQAEAQTHPERAYAGILARLYDEAEARTNRRLTLLQQCPVNRESEPRER